jgi:hypothetical protein
MTQRKKYSALKRGSAIVFTVGATMSLASQPAQADFLDDVGHFVSCFGWMLTDPAKQIAECGKGSTNVGLGSLSERSDGPVHVVTSEPVILPEEEEPECTGSCEF